MISEFLSIRNSRFAKWLADRLCTRVSRRIHAEKINTRGTRLAFAITPIRQIFQRDKVNCRVNAFYVSIAHYKVTNARMPTTELAAVRLVPVRRNRSQVGDGNAAGRQTR